MALTTIKLNDRLTLEQHDWLVEHVGPRYHYLHNSIGGEKWRATKQKYGSWSLTVDEKIATYFTLRFL